MYFFPFVYPRENRNLDTWYSSIFTSRHFVTWFLTQNFAVTVHCTAYLSKNFSKWHYDFAQSHDDFTIFFCHTTTSQKDFFRRFDNWHQQNISLFFNFHRTLSYLQKKTTCLRRVQRTYSVTRFLNISENSQNLLYIAKSPMQIDFRGIDFRGFLGLFSYVKAVFYE